MKTIEVKDKNLLIGEREKPQIGDHEVLIKVKASGINRADIAQATNKKCGTKRSSKVLIVRGERGEEWPRQSCSSTKREKR